MEILAVNTIDYVNIGLGTIVVLVFAGVWLTKRGNKNLDKEIEKLKHH